MALVHCEATRSPTNPQPKCRPIRRRNAAQSAAETLPNPPPKRRPIRRRNAVLSATDPPPNRRRTAARSYHLYLHINEECDESDGRVYANPDVHRSVRNINFIT